MAVAIRVVVAVLVVVPCGRGHAVMPIAPRVNGYHGRGRSRDRGHRHDRGDRRGRSVPGFAVQAGSGDRRWLLHRPHRHPAATRQR